MLKVHLPDGSVREFTRRVRAIDVAQDIGAGLARATIAAEVDGAIVGVNTQLPDEGDVKLRLITKKDPQALGVMRHSCAHIMARAVMRLYDNVQLAFGPTTDNGFYYDIMSRRPITEADFPAIEAEMAKIVKANEPFERIEEPRDQALAVCEGLGQQFKIEHIQQGLAEHPSLSFYRQGEFVDLCRGPHVPAAGAIGAFKLLSVAGAYWKGDQSREQLQRLYGTAFFSKDDLEQHLQTVEEAKRRDHRLLGKQLELFHIDNLVGQGLILWLPKGAVIRGILENFVKDELVRRGYTPVYTPNIGRLELYQISGHYPYYADSQFPPMCSHPMAASIQQLLEQRNQGPIADAYLVQLYDTFTAPEVPEENRPQIAGYHALSADGKLDALRHWLAEQERYLLKPMNCPHHIMIYKSKPRSYRDLPVRLAEFGTVYRAEKSGQLSGMTRVRGFTQDDAHIFCTPDQVAGEFRNCLNFVQTVLQAMGFEDYRVRLGFRDPKSDKYVGSPENWEKAQAAIRQVTAELNLPPERLTVEEGEAAFYGPKADFVVADCLGREWQLGTVQLDYNLPSAERFNLEYIGADNHPHQPVMIHRAPLGSLERFIGVLIEHFAGAFPLWLAPEQVRILVVSQKFEEYGRQVESQLREAGLRVAGDYRSEKIGSKIRDAQLELIPYMFVIGGREMESQTVAVRDRIDGDLGSLTIAAAIEKLQAEVKTKLVRQVVKSAVKLAADGGEDNEY